MGKKKTDKRKTDKRKQKRKAKKKRIKAAMIRQDSRDNGLFYLVEAQCYLSTNRIAEAGKCIKQAAKFVPNEEEVFLTMREIGKRSGNTRLEFTALSNLERLGKIDDSMKSDKLFLLFELGKYKECIQDTDEFLKNFSRLKFKNKREIKKAIKSLRHNCFLLIRHEEEKEKYKIFRENTRYLRNPSSGIQKKTHSKTNGKQHSVPSLSNDNSKDKEDRYLNSESAESKKPDKLKKADKQSEKSKFRSKSVIIDKVPVTYRIDIDAFLNSLSDPVSAEPETYELALLSHEIRFAESFESLICLPELKSVKSFWYQEETAKKILKQFRGRALLSDEVGLGKTIEALIVLKEYIKRNMVKTCLILTPTPLVSQWKEEIKSKFSMDIPSTDDPGYKSGAKKFWNHPFVIASINYAKSKKNFDHITAKQYDMVIVDEAHHLKNRTTLNWKLVNSLKKRFILLLTATPVENNLMELYNLITLLKPGQLETASSFRKRFMTKGDPADPKNQAVLKELLSKVMIRNTRAIAGINIPPRFAETIRIEPTKAEKTFYERLEALIQSLNENNKSKSRIIITNLLAQAGSSPKAVESTLNKMLEKQNYLPEHEEEIRAVKNLCRTTLDTPKNLALLKLVQADKEKIIVFVKFKGTLDHLAGFLEWNDISFSVFHGSMTNQQKDAAIDAFRDKTQVLITTEIGGEGRNLQFCSVMVNYDLPWNPMKIEQRIGRIHRIGQEKEVHIFNFCAAGSIEDYILDILDRKINMFEMVIGEIDMILGRIRGEKDFGDMIYDIWINSKTREERKKAFTNLGTKLKRAKTGYKKSRELDDKLFGDTYEL